MQKKGKSVVVCGIMLLSFLCIGCSKKDGDSTTVDENEAVITNEFSISSQEEKQLDLDTYSLEYEEGTDAQPWFLWTEATSSETGYYFWGADGDYGSLLTYYDVESGEAVPLCNKPECMHNTRDCNAFFNAYYEEGSPDFSRNFIQYYDGFVYIIGETSDGYLNLYKVAADGSSYEEYMKLYKTDNTPIEDDEGNISYESIAFNACIHRGYIYYLIKNESELKVRRMEMGGDTVEIVYETSGIRPNLYRLEAYGDFVFFQTGNFTDEDCMETDGGIVAYNIKSNELSLVRKDIISTYIIVGTDIYYSTEAGVGCFSLVDGSDRMVLDNINLEFTMSADEQYIYVWYEVASYIGIYDHQGNKLSQVSLDDIFWCTFGDSDFFFVEGVIGEDESDTSGCIGILDMSTIMDANPKWTIVK